MIVFLIAWLILGGIMAILGIGISVVSMFEDDNEGIAAGTMLLLAGVLLPIVLPLALIAIPILGVTAMLIELEKVEEPEWWPFS